MRTRWLFLIIFAAAGLQQLGAQTTSPEPDSAALQKRVQLLEQLVNRLEQRVNEMQEALAKQQQKPPAAAPVQDRLEAIDKKLDLLQNAVEVKEQPLINAGRDTFSISSPDKLYRLRIGGHLQVDGKTAYDNKAFYSVSPHQLTDSFVLRRARPILEGSLGRYIDFRCVADFGNGKALIYDAYADVKAKPYAVFRAGKMKTPLGLEQLQGDADLTFIERSLATDLVPNRDEGFESTEMSWSGSVIKRPFLTAPRLAKITTAMSIRGKI